MHIHAANTTRTTMTGETKKRTRSRVRTRPINVATTITAATGRSDATHEYRCGFMMLTRVQPMIPIHGWKSATAAHTASIARMSASRIAVDYAATLLTTYRCLPCLLYTSDAADERSSV